MTTMRRRKKGSAAAPQAAPGAAAARNLEDTAQPDDEGSERWDGDPNEEPSSIDPPQSDDPPPDDPPEAPPPVAAAAAVPKSSEPSAKDRHPMPWGLVVADVFNLDVHNTLKQLEKDLVLGDGASEYGTVLHAVDASAQNLYKAGRLARKAQLVDEQFSTELDKQLEVLRSAAIAELETEVKNKERSKAPTLADIDARMLANWPDKVTSIRTRKAEMHGARRAIDALEVAWKERCQALRTMAQQFRNTGA